MDRIINTKVDKHSIYEIYRACRLCGAGAGYKMPIIQNVIDIDGEEVDLKQKIRECVQIEVHQDDKMPPLICELCVDKVNDFYEFLAMCRETNKRTRKRLGLPVQSTQKGSSDDCILGVTEPVYVNEDSNEPLSKSSPRNAKQKGAKIKKVEVKVETSRSARQPPKRHRSPSPLPRATRHSRGSNEDNQSLSSLKHSRRTVKPPSSPVVAPKSILKKEPKIEEKSSSRLKIEEKSSSRLKIEEKSSSRQKIEEKSSSRQKIEEKSSSRQKRVQEPPKPAIPQKKVKLSVQPVAKPPPPPPMIKCSICKHQSKTSQANGNHMRSHTVTFTSEKLACNACREWFTDVDNAATHHRRHKARRRGYECRGCSEMYDTYHEYQGHVTKSKCVPWTELPDVQCPECWKYFPTKNLMDSHKCQGVTARPGGKCSKCFRSYALLKNLKKHESTCNAKRRADRDIDPVLLSKVRPIQIRMARCDPLLQRISNGHYDVSDVLDYGLDPTFVYPYIHSASLNFNRMVNIKSELDFYCEEDYIHWDSEISDDDDEEKERERKVLTLSTLAIKTLFSQKCLGRVPRKKRKVKTEKSLFDSIMNTDFEMSTDIDNIIDNLGDDNDNIDSAVNDSAKVEDESVEKDVNTSNESNKIEDSTSEKDLSQDKEDSSAETEKVDSLTSEKDGKVDSEETEKSKISEKLENSEEISSENTSASKNYVEDSNKNKESGDNNENNEPADVTATNIIKDSTNADESESKSEEKVVFDSKEVDKESDKLDTEQVNIASELSVKFDSVSESIENKNTDTNLSEADIENSNKDSNINENNDTDETDSDKIKAVDEREISKNTGNERNYTNLVDKNKEISNIDASEVADKSINDNDKSNSDINNTENINDDSQNKDDHVKTYDDSVRTKEINSKYDKIEKSEFSNETNDTNNEEENHKTETNTKDGAASNDTNIPNENDKTEVNSEDVTPNNAKDNNINGVDEKSDKLNMAEFHDVCDSEIDDRKLMDALNEHIGETEDKNDSSDAKENTAKGVFSDAKENTTGDTSDAKENTTGNFSDAKAPGSDVNERKENDKITLDDLVPKKDSDTPSMDLDSISDEEFFDS